MHRIYKIYIGIFVFQIPNGSTHINKTFSKIFTAMSRNQHKFFSSFKTFCIIASLRKYTFKFFLKNNIMLYLIHNPIESINNSITRNYNFISTYIFFQKMFFRERSRSKIVCCNSTSNLTIHFFWPWTINIIRT